MSFSLVRSFCSFFFVHLFVGFVHSFYLFVSFVPFVPFVPLVHFVCSFVLFVRSFARIVD